MSERHGDLFARTRLDAQLDLLHENPNATNAELDAAAQNRIHRLQERIGNRSEKRFDSFAEHSRIITGFRRGSIHDDILGLDMWITVSAEFNLPYELPLQVKSSPERVRMFKFGDPNDPAPKNRKPNQGYLKRHEVEVVMDCGFSLNKEYFNSQLVSELKRIQSILQTHPEYTTSLRKIQAKR